MVLVHSNMTGSRFFNVLEHKTMRLVCCQMLHIYLSKVHSQIQQISMFTNVHTIAANINIAIIGVGFSNCWLNLEE